MMKALHCNEKQTFGTFIISTVPTVLAFLLSIGPDVKIGYILYNLPV